MCLSFAIVFRWLVGLVLFWWWGGGGWNESFNYTNSTCCIIELCTQSCFNTHTNTNTHSKKEIWFMEREWWFSTCCPWRGPTWVWFPASTQWHTTALHPVLGYLLLSSGLQWHQRYTDMHSRMQAKHPYTQNSFKKIKMVFFVFRCE